MPNISLPKDRRQFSHSHTLTRCPPIGGAGKTPCHNNSTQSRQRRQFLTFFSSLDKCRPEAADGVISGVAVEKAHMDARVKFGDFTLNMGEFIPLSAVAQRKEFCLVTRRWSVYLPPMPLRSNSRQVACLSLFHASDSKNKK